MKKEKRPYKIYLAGPLFNEGEVAQRLLEGKLIRERFGDRVDLFNPIEQPFNEDKSTLPSPAHIFKNDTIALLESDCAIFDVTNNDPGVLMELGMVICEDKIAKICHNTDIRLADSYKYKIPSYSMNHFVLGGIAIYGSLHTSFQKVLDELEIRIKEYYEEE